jgi:HEAT repeat protein
MVATALAVGALLLGAAPEYPLDELSLEDLVARVPAVEHATENSAVLDLLIAFNHRGRAAVPKLLPYLADPRPRVRAFASSTLNGLPSQEEDFEPLVAAHRAGDQCALSSIARIGTPRAVRYVVSQMTTREDLWTHAQRVPIGAPGVVELAGFLRSPIPRPIDTVEALCWLLQDKLESKHPSAAVEPLLAIAADGGLPLANRQAAVYALGRIGLAASASKGSLLALAKREPRFSGQVAEALDRFDGKRTLRTALADLDRGKLRGEGWTAGPIREIGDLGTAGKPAVPLLLPYLDLKLSDAENEDDSRLEAIAALGALGDRSAVPALIEVLADLDDWRAVFVAAESLGMLDATEALPTLDRVAASHWFGTVRRMASYVAKVLRGQERVVRLGYAFTGWDLKVPPASGGIDSRDRTAPAGTLSNEELSQNRLARPLKPRPCQLPYPHPYLHTPKAGLQVADGTYLGIDAGEFGGELIFRQKDKFETILRGNVVAVVKLGANLVAVATWGVYVMPDAPPPGMPEEKKVESTIDNGPHSGALFRIERQSDGSHKAILWKTLPGYCWAYGLLKDGRLFLGCEAGDVILRADGVLDRI